MRSTANFQILRKQEWGDYMKLCDILVLLGSIICIGSLEIVVCYVVGWAALPPIIGLDMMAVGILMK